jgi:hypothetical protein
MACFVRTRDCDRGARLVIAIRHLGRGCLVYQPVIFQGALPVNEDLIAALFALAATSPEPIPVLDQNGRAATATQRARADAKA